MSTAAAPKPTAETIAAVEASLLAAAQGGEAPSPETLNRTVAETGLTVGQLGGILQRINARIATEHERANQARFAELQAGKIKDDGDAIVYKRFSEVHGRPHPRTVVSGGPDPFVPVFDRITKEHEDFFETLQNAALRKQRAVFSAPNHANVRENAASATGANPGAAGLTIPQDMVVAIADQVIVDIPWTMSENVFRTGSSEGVVGVCTKLDLDPDTEAETIDGITFDVVGEDEEAPDTVLPTLVEVKGTAKTIAAKAYITRRMRKANPGYAQDFIGKLANAYASIIIRKQVRGSGKWPLGFLNQSLPDFKATLVTRQTAGTVTLKDLRQMRNAIPEPFRTSTMWVTRQRTWDALLDDVDDAQRPKFGLSWSDLVGPLAETGKLGLPVTFSRHLPLLGETGDVCAINPGSLWTMFRQDSLEIMTSDQLYIKTGGFLIVAFADATWGVMPGGRNKGVIALQKKS